MWANSKSKFHKVLIWLHWKLHLDFRTGSEDSQKVKEEYYSLTVKKPGIGPPGIPSWGGIWPSGLGAAAFCTNKQRIQSSKNFNSSTVSHFFFFNYKKCWENKNILKSKYLVKFSYSEDVEYGQSFNWRIL